MTTWVVIYQERETDELFGWFCTAESPSQAEEKFGKAVIVPHGREIKCVTEFQSPSADAHLELYRQKPETESNQDSPVPLQAPANRKKSDKPICIEFMTKRGHMASSDFRDSLPNAVRALKAIAGKWTNATPNNQWDEYTGARVYDNTTGQLLCYGTVEGIAIDWFDPQGELITDLSVLGIQEG